MLHIFVFNSFLFILLILLNYHVVATVGFINTSYNVNEYDGTATVMIGVLSGLIERDIFLSISQLDGSANGE